MEYLKLYDRNHNYIKTDTRENAHKKDCELYHNCVHIIIISSSNKILLQKRSSKKLQHPNLWDLSVTGHVSCNDDFLTACKREMFEEIGLSSHVNNFVNVGEVVDDKNKEFLNLFLYDKKVSEDTKFVFEDNEVSEVKFYNYNDFIKIINSSKYSPYFKEYKMFIVDKIKTILINNFT